MMYFYTLLNFNRKLIFWYLCFCSNYLDLNGHPMFLGGLKDIEIIQTRPGQISSHDFVGCVREFRINTVNHLTSTTPNSQSNVLDKCPRSSPSGHCRVGSCKNGGRCVEEWEGISCRCTLGFSGTTCEIGTVTWSNSITSGLEKWNSYCVCIIDCQYLW